MFKSLNPRKATGPDDIRVMILKIARNVIDSHLTNVNRDIKEKFSGDAKTAVVRRLHKKNHRDKIQNYRPVSILNDFSKVYERYLYSSSYHKDTDTAYQKSKMQLIKPHRKNTL